MFRFSQFIISILITGWLYFSADGIGADFNNVGTTGYTFLEIPVSSRYMALGETGISLQDAGTDGLFINPCLIAFSASNFSLSVNYARWYTETDHQAAGIIYKLPDQSVLGVSALYYDFGDLERTRNPLVSEAGSYVSTGTFTAGGIALGLNYARYLTERFAFGFGLKYVREFIDDYASANVIADVGFLALTGFSGPGFNDLRIAAALTNFGLDAKYIDQKFKMPQQVRLGISAELFSKTADETHFTGLVEVVHPNDTGEHIQMGLENQLFRYLVLRAGYKFGYDNENLTFGLGLKFFYKGRQMRFDAAYQAHEYLDSVLRYTLVMEF